MPINVRFLSLFHFISCLTTEMKSNIEFVQVQNRCLKIVDETVTVIISNFKKQLNCLLS